jgi:membrane associated rhomboid family serine protease
MLRGRSARVSQSVPETPEGDRAPGRLARMPRVVTGLLAAIIAAHVATLFVGRGDLQGLIDALAVNPTLIDIRLAGGDVAGAALPLLGHAFLHGGFIHLFFNAMIILQTGELVAERYGRTAAGVQRFLLLFAVSAVAGALTYIAFNPQSDVPAVGASGAACGLFAAYLLSLRRTTGEALRDGRVLQMAFVFLLVNVGLAAAARMIGVLPIAWEAHLGGFVAGALLHPLLAPRARPAGPWG